QIEEVFRRQLVAAMKVDLPPLVGGQLGAGAGQVGDVGHQRLVGILRVAVPHPHIAVALQHRVAATAGGEFAGAPLADLELQGMELRRHRLCPLPPQVVGLGVDEAANGRCADVGGVGNGKPGIPEGEGTGDEFLADDGAGLVGALRRAGQCLGHGYYLLAVSLADAQPIATRVALLLGDSVAARDRARQSSAGPGSTRVKASVSTLARIDNGLLPRANHSLYRGASLPWASGSTTARQWRAVMSRAWGWAAMSISAINRSLRASSNWAVVSPVTRAVWVRSNRGKSARCRRGPMCSAFSPTRFQRAARSTTTRPLSRRGSPWGLSVK